MQTTINLASKPWVNTATVMRRLRIALGALAGIAAVCVIVLHFEHNKAVQAQQQRQQMDAQQSQMQRQRQAYQAELKEPKNQAVLARAQFLNQVFAGKSFSWTSVMVDLERVLPPGVHVVALEPQVLPDGSIVIRLRVNGDRDRAVELVRNLETSRRFRQPRLAGEATEAKQQNAGGFRPAADTGGVTFDILADYNPLTEAEQHADAKKAAKPAGAAAAKTKAATPPGSAVATPAKGARK